MQKVSVKKRTEEPVSLSVLRCLINIVVQCE